MLITPLTLPAVPESGGPASAASALPGDAPPGKAHPFAKLLSAHQAQRNTTRQPAEQTALAKALPTADPTQLTSATAASFHPAPGHKAPQGTSDVDLTATLLGAAPIDLAQPSAPPLDAKPDDTKDATTPSQDNGGLPDPALAQWAAALNPPMTSPDVKPAPTALAPDATGKIQTGSNAHGTPTKRSVEERAGSPESLIDQIDPPTPQAGDRDMEDTSVERLRHSEGKTHLAPPATSADRAISAEPSVLAQQAIPAEPTIAAKREISTEHALSTARAVAGDRDTATEREKLTAAEAKSQHETGQSLERSHTADLNVPPTSMAAPALADAPTVASALAVTPSIPNNHGVPVTREVTTPVAAPEFRNALGVQVSVLARDGVQHAQLNLTPADMGPISVQIALDGTHARVDFGADTATTRQIIESGMPELAAALRDAGLTLSGGSVSQHSRGQSQNQAQHGQPWGSPQADGGAAERDAVTVRRTGWRVPQGAVDLYA